MTKLLPAMPRRAALLLTVGRSGTGFKNALSTSITSPSTESNCTFSPDGCVVSSGGLKTSAFPQPVAIPARMPAVKNSLLVVCDLMLQLVCVGFFVYPVVQSIKGDLFLFVWYVGHIDHHQ